ncbi:restriction endonuclease subunit S [Oceanospirillum sanctuarii]|uniref:restriction endonuclease subunit S n=1 Tax=Oceanospirillum sanctuarii TaxID=1434821 RepID=UPI000A3C9B5D|nr:restriction endonuclease subunit S [Oceanospirillum sanctuarii]
MAGVIDGVLPEGWVEVALKDIVTVNPKKNEAEPEQNSGFVPMALAPTSFHGELEFEEKPWGEIKKSYTNFKDDDVIFAKVTPCFENGKAAVVRNLPNGIGAGSSEFYVLRPDAPYISEKYIFSLIKTHQFAQEGAENMTGAVGLRRVPRGFVENFSVPLAPLAEQEVIAEKLDNLLAQVESTKARLERLPEILKRFRQSVLAAAVSGKLTEEWREGKELSSPLEIISDSAAFITTKKAKELAEKPFLDDELTFLIPESWHWVRLSKITEIVSGVAKGSKNKGDTVLRPYLRVANVQRGFLDLEEIKDIDVPESKAEALELKNGDILFNEGGDLDKLGRGWIWENQIPNCIHQNHVFRARCLSEGLEPKFISYYGNSEGKEYFIRNGTQSVNLASINKTTLSLLPVPLPPAEEQTEIVRRVEELFAYADTIQEQADAALQRVNSLTQSILAKAFRGELTADWRAANPELISGENSAEALLEKIKAERAAQKPKKKTRAKKTA